MFRSIDFGYLLQISFLLTYCDCTTAQSNAASFQKQIANIANNYLGIQAYQDYVDNELIFTLSQTQGDSVATQIADGLAARMLNHSRIVQNLRTTIETALSATTSSPDRPVINCCNVDVTNATYDVRFRNQTLPDSLCYQGASSTSLLFYNSVLGRMKQNLADVPTLRWQYYANEDGISVVYPATKHCSDTNFDPRLRTWYLTTVSSKPKDVVIVIQKSVSMAFGSKQTNLAAAKNAAKLIINSLSVTDRVGVVAFSDTVFTNSPDDSCYGVQLSVVNPNTRNNLVKFVNYLQNTGNANYAMAFAAAFGMLNTTANYDTLQQAPSDNRDRVIVLLTNGDRISSNINNTQTAIREGNKPFGNKVIIFVYSFQDTTDVNTYMKMLVKQDYNDASYGEIQPGFYQMISQPTRTEMSVYFKQFVNVTVSPSIVFSIPYQDEFGLGLIMSLCVPVFPDGTLTGVTCVDTTVDALFSEVQFFQQTSSSYAFLIDGYGHLMVHPLLPQPQSFSSDVSMVDLTQIEYDYGDKVTELRDSMLRQTFGSSTFSSRRVYRKGDSVLKGVNTEMGESTYFWHQVANTNFSVCVVISSSYENRSVSWIGDYPPAFMMEHMPLQVSVEEPGSCSHKRLLCVYNKSTVILAPKAYVSPSLFSDEQYDATSIASWIDFLEGRTASSNYIKANVRDSVAATFKLDDIWRQRDAYNFSAFRYMGLKDGTFRLFPARRIQPDYDHTRRPWYLQALADRGNYSIYGPFIDSSQTGCYMSVSKAIERQSNTVNVADPHEDNAVLGVMSIMFHISYFGQQLVESFPSCSSPSHQCYVIDRSAFVIYHKSFVPPPQLCKGILDKHLSCMAPDVTQDMINRNVLTASFCISYVNVSRLKFWSMNNLVSSMSRPPYYDIYPIEGTNVYVIDQNTNELIPSTGSCTQCDTNYVDGTLCKIQRSRTTSQCEPSCYYNTEYNQTCRGTLGPNYDSDWPPCIPPTVPLRLCDQIDQEAPYVARVCPCAASWTKDCNRNTSVTNQDCPQNVTISTTNETNTFLCSAESFPPVSVYQWTNNGNPVGSNSPTYTVPSGVEYNISCTVTNYLLGGTSNPCSGTAFAIGVSSTDVTPSPVNTDAIVLGVLFGVSFLVNIGLVVYLIIQRRRTVERSQSKEPQPASSPTYEGLSNTMRASQQRNPVYDELSASHSTDPEYVNVSSRQ